jgi:aspartyl-tRNA(Asn)/glutamyl-tRNA(Gln) amidotransferase subunit C
MISKDDIKHLADLSRIEISDGELETLSDEIDAILEYVGQVKSITAEEVSGVDIGPVKNVFREDIDPNEPGTFKDDLIAEFPNKSGDYLKVKKIL